MSRWYQKIIAKAVACKLNGGSPWGFLRHWPKEDNGWGLAQVVAERAGYAGIGCIYYEDFDNSYSVDHFAPEVDYTNKCAVDFSPGKPGKEALDSLRRSENVRSYMISASRRKDVSERRKVIEARWGRFSRERPAAARTWEALDAVSRWYLLMRACDWVMYGKEFADRSFPDPSNSDYSSVVSALVWLFEEHETKLIKKLEDAEEVKKREYIEKHCAESVEKIVVSPPEQLTPRVLDSAQIRTVRDACIEAIKHSPQAVYEVAGTIDELAVFCELLAQPDNRIKARHINTRAEADMVNEMARVLTSIPKYTAYAKVVQEKTGEPIVWKGRVQPTKLSDVSAGAPETARLAIEKRALDYTRPREEIREEIARRQEKWRRRVSVEAPSGATAEKKRVDAPKQGVAPPGEEAPPPRMVFTKEDGGQAPEDAGKVRLVYRSDFTKPTGWDENHSEAVKVFRLDGYYHILVFDTNHYVYFNPPIIMDNFRAQVEAEFTAQTGVNGECGLVFGARSANGENFYHMFGIRPDGNYRLDARVSKEYGAPGPRRSAVRRVRSAG